MSSEKPEDKQPETNDNASPEDLNQSDALKRAILKLKEQGLLTHIPDELMGESSSKSDDKPSTDEQTIASRDTLEKPHTFSTAKPQARPDEETIVSRPQMDSPTIATTSDDTPEDVEKLAAEKAAWSSVLSGWDDAPTQTETKKETPQAADQTLLDAKLKTQESERIRAISPEDEKSITLKRKEIRPQSEDALTGSRDETPWTLQQFFDGEIDLDKELSNRFPTIPPMTSVKLRTLGSHSGRKVATLATQDGSATVIFDADISTKVVQISFTYGSMLTLRFSLRNLNSSDRSRWLELMRREQGGLAFLWGPSRWNEDYIICVSRKYSTNIYAFSPRNFEAAIRMTASVTEELLNWLEEIWNAEPEPEDDEDSPLLTW